MINTSYNSLFTYCLILLSFTSAQGCEQSPNNYLSLTTKNDAEIIQFIKANIAKKIVKVVKINDVLIEEDRYQRCKQEIEIQALKQLSSLINDTFYINPVSEESIQELIPYINPTDLYKARKPHTFGSPVDMLLHKIYCHTPDDTIAINNFKLFMKYINSNHQECGLLSQAFFTAAGLNIIRPEKSPHLLKLLVDSGLNINRLNKKGQTIFQEQLDDMPFNENFYIRALQGLVEYGFYVDNKDEKEYTAFDYAKKRNFKDLSRILFVESHKQIVSFDGSKKELRD